MKGRRIYKKTLKLEKDEDVYPENLDEGNLSPAENQEYKRTSNITPSRVAKVMDTSSGGVERTHE